MVDIQIPLGLLRSLSRFPNLAGQVHGPIRLPSLPADDQDRDPRRCMTTADLLDRAACLDARTLCTITHRRLSRATIISRVRPPHQHTTRVRPLVHLNNYPTRGRIRKDGFQYPVVKTRAIRLQARACRKQPSIREQTRQSKMKTRTIPPSLKTGPPSWATSSPTPRVQLQV